MVYVIQYCRQLSQAVCKTAWHIPLLCVQWKTPDNGQRNCLKHAEFHSKNKFEKLVHLAGFNIQIYHDARSHECQNPTCLLNIWTSGVQLFSHCGMLRHKCFSEVPQRVFNIHYCTLRINLMHYQKLYRALQKGSRAIWSASLVQSNCIWQENKLLFFYIMKSKSTESCVHHRY